MDLKKPSKLLLILLQGEDFAVGQITHIEIVPLFKKYKLGGDTHDHQER